MNYLLPGPRRNNYLPVMGSTEPDRARAVIPRGALGWVMGGAPPILANRTVTAGKLLAFDTADRLLNYLLLPWGEPGRTSVGTVTVEGPGVIELPDDARDVILNIEHDPDRPVGHAVAIEETRAGLLATFYIANTTGGNDLLIEAIEGLRTGISIELEGHTMQRHLLTGGQLVGAGAVVTPAFPSARIRIAS